MMPDKPRTTKLKPITMWVVEWFHSASGEWIPVEGNPNVLMLAFQWGCREKWEPTGGWHDDEELEMADVLNSPEREVSAGDPAKESQ